MSDEPDPPTSYGFFFVSLFLSLFSSLFLYLFTSEQFSVQRWTRPRWHRQIVGKGGFRRMNRGCDRKEGVL